jgi:hypothetical protein
MRIGWRGSDGSVTRQYVHRVAWELMVEAPGDRIIRHWWPCSAATCCNVRHLSPYGSHAANARDRDLLGRRQAPTGQDNGRARLSNEQAQQIRAARAAGLSVTLLAAEFSVGRTTIYNVVRGRSYRSA